MELRSYQSRSIDDLLESFRSGYRRNILCGCTGYGKTIVGAEIIRRSIEKGKNVLWLADRKELIWQARKRFEDFGIGERVGVIMAGEESDLSKPVQIASVMTYSRRLKLSDLQWNGWFHRADLIIYDECHASLAPIRKGILNLYKDKYLIGLSATPGRSDKAAFGEIYQDIVQGATIRELTELGFLVPVKYYGSKLQPDLKGVPEVCGEFEKRELGKRVDQPKLVGDILENWLRIADGRQTIVFATNIKHSKHIRDSFRSKGIRIEHVDAHTPRDERMEILDGLQDGRINVVTNCGVYVEGVDVPAAAVCVLARPVRFVGRFIQMGGRVLRPFPGKSEAVIIDHAASIGPPHGHGFLDDTVEWVLEGKEIKAKKQPRKKEKTILTCEFCSSLFVGRRCPTCGNEIKDYGKKIAAIDADLQEIKKPKSKKTEYTMDEKRQWYGMFEYERRRLGKNHSWLLAQYKSKFKVWPRGMDEVGPIEPNDGVKNWLKYQRIKFIKSQQKREKQEVVA